MAAPMEVDAKPAEEPNPSRGFELPWVGADTHSSVQFGGKVLPELANTVFASLPATCSLKSIDHNTSMRSSETARQWLGCRSSLTRATCRT